MSHILVTGGSRGIGKAICSRFAESGWNVSYIDRNTQGEGSDNLVPICCDVSDPVSVEEAVRSAESRFGAIDVLVSNSGISMTGLATDHTYEDMRRIMDTNFGGFFNISKAVIPSMVHVKRGVIIAVSSMWGQTGASCESVYSASKGAVDAYAKSLAKELAPSGIRVNVVSPGVINTDMMSSYTDDDKKELAEETPLGRLGKPEDVAETVYFLASDKASYITGQIIGINGGYLI
ncbi:MAG: SDR family oxidoreductase [Clostridiales bacterium]|nr:SDR family oxidoreductase [Clostridiales bacterium]